MSIISSNEITLEQKLALMQDHFGQSHLEKSLQIATLLRDIEADPNWLTSITDAAKIALSGQITDALPKVTQQLAHQFMQFDAVDTFLQSAKEQKNEASRKIFISLASDVRVILLALAQKIVTLRYLKNTDHHDSLNYAKYAIDIFSPLANRLGIWQLKWQLEDAALRILEPVDYKNIARYLEQKRTQRKQVIDDLMQEVEDHFLAHQLKAQIMGRPKHIYSIWRKQQNKFLNFDNITDLLALRVIVDDIDACYRALSLIQERWPSLQSEYTDYIARPKENGYRSLHIVVLLPDNKPVEIQIRTKEMHRLAEYGVAAHWRYKEANTNQNVLDDKMLLLRQLLAWQAETHQTSDAPAAVLKHDYIYVLTPDARVIELPQGATAIDFAYHLHSQVGHCCKGALINGVMAPLNRRLKNGEVLDILTHKMPSPSRDWLKDEFTASRRTKAKIRAWFNAIDKTNTLTQGREQLQKILQREGRTAFKIETLAQKLGFANEVALFFSLGKNEIGQQAIVDALKQESAPTNKNSPTNTSIVETARSNSKTNSHQFNAIVVEGVSGVFSSCARCCRPVHGEAIIGYISRTNGVNVHRASCSNLKNLQSKTPEKIITVRWQNQSEQSSSVILDTYLNDSQPELVCDTIRKSGVTLIHYSWHGTSRCLQTECKITNIKTLNQLIAKISALSIVESIRRI